MKNGLIITALMFLSNYTFCQKKDACILSDSLKTKAEKVVESWFAELFKADNIDKIMQISDVPFALDREEILTKAADLKETYLDIFEKKGKREIPKHITQYVNCKSEIVDDCIPINVARFVVYIGESNNRKGILLCLQLKNDNFKVVGFSD